MNCQLRSLLIGMMLICLITGADADLVHRYSFTDGDTGAVDSVGTQHGTLEGGAAISGNAVHLDGSSQYVNLPADLVTGLSSVTFEVWFSHSANGSWTRVFDFGNTNGNGSNYIFFTPLSGASSSRLVITDGGGGDEEYLNYTPMNYNETIHIACVYDGAGSTMSFYLNGTLIDTISVTVPLSGVNNVYSYLGRSLYSADPYLMGSIDEFRIYDHALDAEEVSYNYAAGPDVMDAEYTATNPDPAKNAISVSTSTLLSWTAPSTLPDSYTVYLSENSDYSNPQVIEVASGTSCAPVLDSQATYYWRVDTNYGETTYSGIAWNFSTCVRLVDTSPAGDLNQDYEVDIRDMVVLAELWLDDMDLVILTDLAADWLEREPSLIINEFMAYNDEAVQDPDGPAGEYDDWIEIFNRSSMPRDLSGMYLTDNMDNPVKWMIPEGVTVDAYGYIVFWADGQTEQGDLHANFKLDADGDDIALYDTDGTTLLDSVDFDDQYRDMSYGRFPDNALAWNLFAEPTPGQCNCQGYDGAIAEVKFSVDGGIYSDPSEAFDVYLTCDTPDVVIRYTTDFTDPTESSTEYTGPIYIDSTTCLRAAAFKADWYPAKAVSRTYVFLDDVVSQSSLPSGFPSSWGANRVDYQVDPDVVNDPAYSGTFKDDLKTIPSVCVVIPNDDFFGAASGIYANATQRGDAWERQASIEFVDPATGQYYQANAGLRAQGGVGRGTGVAKHSLRIIFRNMYGPSKMEFPLFNDSDVTSFDQLVLRGTWNYSWVGDSTCCNGLGDDNAQYMREMYGHDTVRDMGGLQGYGRHVHLYINGLYWGLYILVERPDEGFASEHLGGGKNDYDVVKTAAESFGGSSVIEVISGDRQAWDQLFTLAAGDLSDPANYAQIQQYVDIPALIDYMLTIYHTGSRDAPVLIGSDTVPRNFYAIRKREQGQGFVFIPWDVEWSLENENWDRVNVGAYASGYENPAYLMTRLKANEEFCMQIADRAHEHYFNDGVLSEANTIARYWQRSMDIDRAIIGESARWGDSLRSTPYTRNIEWVAERNRLINTYFPVRDDVVLSQLKTAGFYPNVDAPVFGINGSYQHGGHISSTDLLSMTAPSGTIWYTLDGTDPRLPTVADNDQIIAVAESADKRVLVPSGDLGTDWRGDPSFNDNPWDLCTGSPGGVGYENGSGYEGLISLDMLAEMYGSGKNTTCYIRIPFSLTSQELADITSLMLNIRYDDAFVAYLNGTEVARRNFTGTPEWDSNADNGNHEATTVGWDESIDISSFIGDLEVGDNILAIQGINYNDTSSDFVICTELVGSSGAVAGGVSPEAIEYTVPITLTESKQVKARVLDGSQWSALNGASYSVGPVAENLRISEIMYHPADPNTEYIELQNIGAETINPALVQFTNGIDFTFPSVELASGQYVLVAENPAELTAAAPDIPGSVPVFGPFTGSLDNDGDKIELADAAGQLIHSFKYKDGWHDITDGDGFSLTVIDPAATDPNLWDTKAGWRPSAAVGGSPGYDDSGVLPDPGAIVINEVLAHSHATAPDWIELYNTTDAPIHIGGWFLSDSNADDPNMMKYEIPLGTSIDGGDYIVFQEDDTFGNPTADGVNTVFALSEGGDTVYLRSGMGGVIGGYEVSEDFGASATNVAFGRHIKSLLDGGVNFVPMSTNTPETQNAYPQVGPIVITEIMYNPAPANTGGEYIELHNITSQPVSLEDVVSTETAPGSFTTETVQWQFSDGIDFTFPENTAIPANGYLIIAQDPTAFTAYYGAMPSGVDVLGPFANDTKLSNGGEQIQIVRPGDQEYGQQRYWIRTERVTYDDQLPWPVEPDGTGDALHQKTPDTAGSNYGNDAANWMADTPSPGQS